MSRSFLNFLLDILLLLAFLVLIWAAMIVAFVFPPGPETHGWLLWGMTFDQWVTLEFGLVATMTIGILLHVMLHWNWVCGIIATKVFNKKVKPDDGAQTLYGVGMLIALLIILGVAVAAAALSIQNPVR